jgi:uncharacterized protein (TIGR00369 family)
MTGSKVSPADASATSEAASTSMQPLTHGALHNCFGCGQDNESGLRLEFSVDAQHQVHCTARIPERFQGPPGYVHGGIIATLLDEAMSKANRQFGVVAMTRQMEVEYLKPVPVDTPIKITGRHLRVSGRKHHCEAEITSEDGTVLAQGRALFVAIDPAMLKRGRVSG